MEAAAIGDSSEREPQPENRPEFVHRLLAAAAIRDPKAVALIDADGPSTYDELLREAGRFAQWLLDRGVGKGDRVAVDATPDFRFAVMLYGCLAIGGVCVPVSTTLTNPEREYVLANAVPVLVISDLRLSAYERITFSSREVWERLPASPYSFELSIVDGSDSALLIYTSGSTSRPKGVLCRHAQVAFAVGAIGSRLGYRADDIVFTRLPMSFDYGLYQLFLCAGAGAAVALASPECDAKLLKEIEAVGATVVPLVPALADMLITLTRRRSADRTVRLFTNTGERLDPARITALRTCFPSAAVQLMYGLTECKRVAIGAPDGDLERPGSVGLPLDGTAVTAVDPTGKTLAPFETGELVVVGPHVMDGYWQAPERTREVFRRGNDSRINLHTGDWGHLDADGFVYLSGRRDDQFKSRGVRTSATEIEQAANTIPGVRRAVVLPPRGDDEAVLCVVSVLRPETVLQRLHEVLESAKVPRVCRVFASFPLSANGKVDHASLAEQVRG